MTTASPQRAPYTLRLFAICAALVALALKQAPGQLVGDTKLDLAADPMRLLSRAMHLWDPSRDFGLTQNQNYGYLFPMGPFFVIGRAIGLPPWAVQRLWWALLLCLAFVGLVKLAEALGIGTPTSRLLAGLGFALSPRILSTIGPISVESLPYCLAPWVLLPLVRGSTTGSPRRAAARSAVAVLCMGAVNAVAVLAALPPAVLWLLTRKGGPRRRALAGWWVGCVLLATAWWVVPLVLLGKYSPPFLDYIESASTTTAVTSLIEVLRGTSDWIAYLAGGGGPTWPAGYALLTNRLVIAYTVVVLLAGLAGLLRRDLPERLWLTACLLLGVAAVTAGHLGHLSGLLASFEHAQLDAALAPLRNVHKFDVVLRLPLALGVAHLLGRLMTSTAAPGAARRQRIVVVVAATAAVLGAALPAVGVGLAPRQPFTEIPGYWQQTARWLADHSYQGRALLVPGSSFPDYLWGNSNDEPLQPLARSEWAVRSAIPLTPPGTIRMLDAIEQRLAAGEPSPGLAEDLRRMGIAYVVVRNDLAYARAGSTRPLLVHEALDASPGITRWKGFGPRVGGGNGVVVDEGLEVPYTAVEIFAVGPAQAVELRPLSDVAVVTGGSEAVADLTDRGLLAGRPAVLAQDAPSELTANPHITTDTLRRREVSFGGLSDNRSQTLTAGDPYRIDAPAHDYLPADAGQQTVARYIGAKELSASSSESDADALGGAYPDRNPYAAVDGDVTTSWRSNPGKGLSGATWRITFPAARSLAGITVQLGGSAAQRPSRVRVTTEAGSVTSAVDGHGRVAVPAGTSPFLQLTAIAAGSRDLGAFDIAEIVGLTTRRTLDVPRGGHPDVIALSAAPGARPACYRIGADVPLCSIGVGRRSEESTGLDRTLHGDVGGSYSVAATASPVPGPALDALLDAGTGVTVTASTSAVQDPYGRPGTVVDGDPHTGWRAAPGDPRPTLVFDWTTTHTIRGIRVDVDPSLAASRPQAVTVSGGGRSEGGTLHQHHLVLKQPIRTKHLMVRLELPKIGGSVDPFTRVLRLLPVGVSEVTFDGSSATKPPKRLLDLGCDNGPTIAAGGRLLRTRAVTSREQLAALRPVPLVVCKPAPVNVGDGTEVIAAATTTFAPTSLTLTSHVIADAGAQLPLATQVWSADRRQVRVPDRSMQTLLQVHENINAGWTATLAGKRLRPIVVDGWQQGWIVPAGKGGVVHLDYTPDGLYRRALAVGAFLVLLVLLLGLLPGGSAAPAVAASRTRAWHVAVLLAVLALIGGPAALLLAVIAAAVRARPSRMRSAAAVGAVGAAGALLVVHPWARAGYLGRGATTQALCLIGLAVMWSELIRGDGMTTGRLRQVISGRSTKR